MISKGIDHAVVFSGVGSTERSLPTASCSTSPSLREPLVTTVAYSSLLVLRFLRKASASGVGANLLMTPRI